MVLVVGLCLNQQSEDAEVNILVGEWGMFKDFREGNGVLEVTREAFGSLVGMGVGFNGIKHPCFSSSRLPSKDFVPSCLWSFCAYQVLMLPYLELKTEKVDLAVVY